MRDKGTSDRTAPARGSGREALIAAASELMNERDTLEISLSEIAARANANSALVKYYFGNKQGLMLAVLERDVGRSLDQLNLLVDSPASPAEKLRVHIAGLINLYFRCRYLNKLLFALLRDSTPDQAQQISDKLVRPAAEAQRRVLEEGVRSGDFRQVDPMLFYFTVIGACDQFFTAQFALKTVFGQDGIDDELRRRFIDHTTSILISGVSAKTVAESEASL